MFCTLKWVESDEAINAFSALSDNEILQELDKLGVQRAMIDTGAAPPPPPPPAAAALVLIGISDRVASSECCILVRCRRMSWALSQPQDTTEASAGEAGTAGAGDHSQGAGAGACPKKTR